MPKETVKKHSLRAVPSAASQKVVPPKFESDSDEVCQKCFGSGMEVVEGKGARLCECRTRDPHTVRLAQARIPVRYQNCYFSSYDYKLNDSQKDAKVLASQFAQTYPAVSQGILFSGPVGVGKTHLAVSILHGLIERGFPSMFYEFGSLLKEIQDSYNPNTQSSELAILNPILTTDVLVLDELGASKPTDWVRDTLAHIINTRYNEKKFTIFTTNFSDERPVKKEETLEDRIGVRVRSRIFEMCRTVKIEGEDYRRNFDRSRIR